MTFLRTHSGNFAKPSLNEQTFEQALSKAYPDKHSSKLDFQEALKAIHAVAHHCNNAKYSFCRIPRKITDTEFASIEGLDSIADKVKLFVFPGKRDKVKVLMHLRGMDEMKIRERSKSAERGVHFDLNLRRPEKGTVIPFTHLKTKTFEAGTKEESAFALDCNAAYLNEVKFLSGFRKTEMVPRLLCHLADTYESKGKICTKYRLFVEAYDKDLATWCKELIANKEKLSQDEQAEIVIRLVYSLYHFHQKKVINGAIKPENILVTREGEKKRFSFGNWAFAAQLKRNDDKVALPGAASAFLSHESFLDWIQKDEPAPPAFGISSEVWALGCTLHLILKGNLSAFSLLQQSSFDLAHVTHLVAAEADKINMSPQSSKDSPVPLKRKWESGSSASFTEDEKLLSTHFEPASYIASALMMDHSSQSSRSFTDLSQSTPSPIPLKLNRSKSGKSQVLRHFEHLDHIKAKVKSAAKQLKNLPDVDDATHGAELENVVDFHTMIEKVNSLISEHLLNGPIVDNVRGNIPYVELVRRYKEITSQVQELNDQLINKVLDASEPLKVKHPDTGDDLMNLVMGMMNPDPENRLSLKEALKQLKQIYPEVYRRSLKSK